MLGVDPTAPSIDFVGLLGQIGLGAIIVLPFIWVWRRAEARADRAEARNDVVLDLMVNEFTPTLVRTQEAMKAYDAGLSKALLAIENASAHQLDPSQVTDIIRLLNRLDS